MKRQLIKCAKALYKQGRINEAKNVWKIANDGAEELRKLIFTKLHNVGSYMIKDTGSSGNSHYIDIVNHDPKVNAIYRISITTLTK